MDRFADFILHHRKGIIVLFIAAAAICTVMSTFVGVNYDMTDYLPPDAQSTKALAIMEDEFGSSMPNTNVMVNDVSVQEALQYKQGLLLIDGVTEVLWLDDVIDLKKPLEMADAGMVEEYYKDGAALFTVTVEEGMEADAVGDIWELVGEDNAVSGEAPDNVTMQGATSGEVGNAVAILLPVIIAILVLSSSSWIEPVLFLLAIGISILINMGTNVFLGEVSFITNSVSPILQLAVSLDYAIFLLHSFADNRKKYGDPDKAMHQAIKESVSTVSASALTTLFGFLALAFMNFQIGADLGLNLAKGIILSFVSTMIFLPALVLSMYKLLDKTKHRPLMPNFKNVNRFFSRLAIPAIILVAILIIPSFLGQGRTEFIYGNDNIASNSEKGDSRQQIQDKFGQSTVIALLVPRGDVAREQALGEDVKQLDHVTSVVSYASSVGTAFPVEFLSTDVTSQFYSDNYARIVVYTDTLSEGEVAFQTVEEVMAVARSYYGDEAYSVGQSSNLYDMKTVVQVDNRVVTLIAVIAIFLVLLITFRSATLPFILLLTIETGIWVNLAIPYFSGTSINFIGYLVLNTVQLGATVDYAILLTNTYIRKRRLMPQKEAMHKAMGEAFKSILVSAAVLAVAGFTLYATSTNPPVRDIGLLLGRGTVLSFIMVVCFLPAMLKFFDKAIAKTTYKSNFFGLNRLKGKEDDYEKPENES